MDRKIRRIDYSPDEWIAGTLVLSVEEEGLYSRLVARVYSRGGALELEGLAAYCRCDPRRFRRLLAGLVRKGKVRIDEGTLAIDRCEIELRSARDRVEIARNSAAKRWKNNGVGNAPQQCYPSTTNHQEETSSLPAAPPPSLRSVGEAAAEAAPERDLVKELWDRGAKLLGEGGRSVIGKLRNQHGNAAVMDAIIACETHRASDPLPYLQACLANAKGNGNGRNHRVSARENLWLGFAQAADSDPDCSPAPALLDRQ